MSEMEYGNEQHYGEEMDGSPDMDHGDMYGMEGEEYDQQMDEENMDDEYGMEMDMGYQDDDINFENNPEYARMPPLDTMRKIRRTIFKTINDVRTAHGSPPINIDFNANKAATDYATYLLSGPENEKKCEEFCANNLVIGKVIPLVGFAILEEEEDHQGTLFEQMMDAHGLLLELEYELKVLADPKHTHVGIGFAFTKEQVKVVELVSEKPLMISEIQELPDGGVECTGTLLNREVGFYAARIAPLNKLTKELKVVGPSNIKFDKSSGNFSVTLPGPLDNFFYNHEDPKVLEFYIRRNQVDKIVYGVESNERINVVHLEKALTLPLELLPDPRILIEDAADQDREVRERELKKKREEQQALAKEAEKLQRLAEQEKKKQAMLQARENQPDDDGEDQDGERQGRDSDNSGDSDGMNDDDDDMGEDSDQTDDMAELPSQNEMKQDLIQAIEEDSRERDQLVKENEELQKQIILMESNMDQYEKTPDAAMNEHKYLNTLANVHQVRLNLKETQDRYNKMAAELQAKLNEKQAKCSEIDQQFKELKRSVAQNAVFSRTGKKIQKKTLDEWEEGEVVKDQEVHQYRLQNIALRNRLANKQKILTKKDQLADGLHLIDFEQLKIENQTLNEKIEERNEELHKLRTNITSHVVKLSHTREKQQFIVQMNIEESETLNKLKQLLEQEKKQQSLVKKKKEAASKELLKLKQETGISKVPKLKRDFDLRKMRMQKMEEEILRLKQKHEQLNAVIEQANMIESKKNNN